MTLTTHALVGAALASLMPQEPVLALTAAFCSHFVLDALPHGDYKIYSASIHPRTGAPMKYDKALLLDALRIGTDALLGPSLSLLFFARFGHPLLVFVAACIAILPDPLQFVYTRWKHEPLISLQRFHQWVHTSHRLSERPVLAIVSQTAFVVLVVGGVLQFLA
jgi:hypothetical protein